MDAHVTKEELVVMIVTMVTYMAPDELERACDHMNEMPLSQGEEAKAFIRMLREETTKT